jgi:hypothetical protein
VKILEANMKHGHADEDQEHTQPLVGEMFSSPRARHVQGFGTATQNVFPRTLAKEKLDLN